MKAIRSSMNAQTLLHFSRQLAVQSDHHFIVFSICDARARASSSSRCRCDCKINQKGNHFFFLFFQKNSNAIHHGLPIRFRQIDRLRQLLTKRQHLHCSCPPNGVRCDGDANVLAEPVHFVPFCSRTIPIARGYYHDSCLWFFFSLHFHCMQTKMTEWATTLTRPKQTLVRIRK